MEVFSLEFFIKLLGIVVMDLVLGGDNAIVIGMAARRVPKQMQRNVIVMGTVGAVVIRIAATLAVAWLLGLPGLRLVGGLLLLLIAYNLMVGKEEHEIKAKDNVWAAVGTIIMADAAMGIDNVLAVAAAAQESFLLVILGLLISIPIVVWGSTLFIKLIDRFAWILYVGAGIIAYTAAHMITKEGFMHNIFINAIGEWVFVVLAVAIIVIVGYVRGHAKKNDQVAHQA